MLENNPGLSYLQKVAAVLEGRGDNTLTPEQLQNVAVLKYAPVTSCDVERSFSAYKQVLTNKRRSMTVGNIEKKHWLCTVD